MVLFVLSAQEGTKLIFGTDDWVFCSSAREDGRGLLAELGSQKREKIQRGIAGQGRRTPWVMNPIVGRQPFRNHLQK